MSGNAGPPSEVLDFLRSLPLFSHLNETSARSLAAVCRFRRLEKGEILFLRSDFPEAVYVVRSGRISIVLDSPDGRQPVIDEMRPGEILGELGLLTLKTHSASAAAQSSSQVLVIPREAFLQVIDQDPGFTRLLLELTAQRLHQSAARELALAFMDAEARLARHLLVLETHDHEKGYVTVSQEELAHSTGLIRQTVAKALGRWRRQGWLLTGRGRILILNRRALEEIDRGLLISQ